MASSVHARKMRRLRRDAGVRALDEIVHKLTPRVLLVLLDGDGLSTEGTLEELRDRRLRFDVLKFDTGLDVPVYEDDYRGERLPVTTAELLTEASREENGTPAQSEGRVAGRTEELRAPQHGFPEQVVSDAPAAVVESHPPMQPESRVWSVLSALPRLFFRRELREALSRSGNHVVREERVGVDCQQRNSTGGATRDGNGNTQRPVDNVATVRPHGGVVSASTPAEDSGVNAEEWEELVRRTLFRSSREGPSGGSNGERSQPTLSRVVKRDRESNREVSVARLRDTFDAETSSSDSEDDVEREIAANAPSAASSGMSGRDSRNTGRSDALRTVNAVKALKDWHISFSGSSSEDAEEFLERLMEMQRYYRLCDAEILKAIPCALTERALQWFRSVGRESRSLNEFDKHLREHFGKKMDREDVYDELRSRTQAPEEKVACYLAAVKCIIARFNRPPSVAKQLRIVYRNLHPKFRHFLEGKSIESFEELHRWGIDYERRRELDQRYVPPPSKNEALIPAAAFRREESVVSATSAGTHESTGARRDPPKGKRKKRQAAPQSTDLTGIEEVAVDAVMPGGVPAITYREVQQQSHPGVGRGQPGRALPAAYRVQSQGTATRPGRQEEGARVPFKGRCFLCNNVGHRQSECSMPVCYACGQPGHYASACTQGRRGTNANPPTSASNNNQIAQRSMLLGGMEIGTLGYAGERAALQHSQEAGYREYDLNERRVLLRGIQTDLDTETNAVVHTANHIAIMSAGEEANVESAPPAENLVIESRAQLQKVNNSETREAESSAPCAGSLVLRGDQMIANSEPDREPLSNQPGTSQGLEQVAEMALENRNIVSVKLGGREFKAIIDSGAMVSLVGPEIAKLCRSRIIPSSTIVRGVNGSALHVLGKLKLMLEIDGVVKPLEVRAIEGIDHQMILGIDFCRLWELEVKFAERIWRVRGGEYREFASREAGCAPILIECAGITRTSDIERERVTHLVESTVPPPAATLGHTTLITHHIEVDSSRPVRCAPRRMSPRMLEIAQEVRRMRSEGVIEPSASDWCSAPVIAKKSNGGHRFCVDFRDLEIPENGIGIDSARMWRS